MSRSRIVMSMLLAAAAAACERPSSPVAPDSRPAEPRGVEAPGLDGEFVRIAREMPGFGGYYRDASGTLNVVLTDPLPEATVRGELVRLAPRQLFAAGASPAIRVRKGDYSFDRLSEWNQRMLPLLGLPGVVFTDADEAANRVRVGVVDDAAAARVRAGLRSMDVPEAAVIIERTEPLRLATGLSVYTRPTVGGLEIHPNPTQSCSLGFNAIYAGMRVFATASHCTPTQGFVDGTVFTQGGAQIGVEVTDPPMSARGFQCPANYICRRSDMALVRYDDSVSSSLGTIAHTLFRGYQSSGSTDPDPLNPFHIVGIAPPPLMGDTVHKVGSNTGWTAGPVYQTCVNYSPRNNVKIVCSHIVTAFAGPGDSGSPAFTVEGGTSVRLAGIVWAEDGGRDPATGLSVVRFIYSDMNQIGLDFGTITTF
ncbi:MAG TPA: hypothetical protein VFJ82_19570 [Longimicrobium sp.]|nr:hypothetical protein [Longimicrobium sp.]